MAEEHVYSKERLKPICKRIISEKTGYPPTEGPETDKFDIMQAESKGELYRLVSIVYEYAIEDYKETMLESDVQILRDENQIMRDGLLEMAQLDEKCEMVHLHNKLRELMVSVSGLLKDEERLNK